jgi:hypothetical protein
LQFGNFAEAAGTPLIFTVNFFCFQPVLKRGCFETVWNNNENMERIVSVSYPLLLSFARYAPGCAPVMPAFFLMKRNLAWQVLFAFQT